MVEEQPLPGSIHLLLRIRTTIEQRKRSELFCIEHGFFAAANAALGVVADVSLLTRSVHHVTSFTPNAFGAKLPDAPSVPTARSVVSGDATRLFFTTGWDIWTFDVRAGKVDGPILVNAPIADLAVSGDSRRLYVATAKDPALPLNDPPLVFDSTSGAPLPFPRAATSLNGR